MKNIKKRNEMVGQYRNDTPITNNYSKKLSFFKSVDIRLLVNLKDITYIDPDHREYVNKGDICQLQIMPDLMYHVGRFVNGSGSSFYEFKEINKFIEGIHFEFV